MLFYTVIKLNPVASGGYSESGIYDTIAVRGP